MIGAYKASIVSFILPIVTCLIALYIPDINPVFTYISAFMLILNIVVFLVMLSIFKKRRRQNAARLLIIFNTLTAFLFFTFPLLKVLIGYNWLQAILVVFFFICILLSIYDQKSETPIVFPDKGKRRRFDYLFYVIPVVVCLLGGGGSIIASRIMTDIFGDALTSIWGSSILYILGCWLAFVTNSIFYQGFAKNGVWIK